MIIIHLSLFIYFPSYWLSFILPKFTFWALIVQNVTLLAIQFNRNFRFADWREADSETVSCPPVNIFNQFCV